MDALEQLKKRQAEDQRSAEAEQAAREAADRKAAEANTFRIQECILHFKEFLQKKVITHSERRLLSDAYHYAGLLAAAERLTQSAWEEVAKNSTHWLPGKSAGQNVDIWYLAFNTNHELAEELFQTIKLARQHEKQCNKKAAGFYWLVALLMIAGTVIGVMLHISIIPLAILFASMVIVAVRSREDYVADESAVAGYLFLTIILSVILGFAFHSFLIPIVCTLAATLNVLLVRDLLPSLPGWIKNDLSKGK